MYISRGFLIDHICHIHTTKMVHADYGKSLNLNLKFAGLENLGKWDIQSKTK